MAPLVLRSSALLVLAAAGVAAATGGALEPSTTTTSTITRFLCQGDKHSFNAGYGDCANYWPGLGPNYYYCDEDSDGNFTAKQVCSECGLCDIGEAARTEECHGDRSSFDAGFGGCEYYVREQNWNWAFCHSDVDNATGLLAHQVCSECQRCHLPPLSQESPPSSGGLNPAASAAVGGALLLLLLLLGVSGGALTLRSRQCRRAGDSTNDGNAVFAADDSGAPAVANGFAEQRRIEWNVDQSVSRSMDWSVEQGVPDAEQGLRVEQVSEIEQSNGLMRMASNPSFA